MKKIYTVLRLFSILSALFLSNTLYANNPHWTKVCVDGDVHVRCSSINAWAAGAGKQSIQWEDACRNLAGTVDPITDIRHIVYPTAFGCEKDNLVAVYSFYSPFSELKFIACQEWPGTCPH